MAQSGHAGERLSQQLSGVKRTRLSLRRAAVNDPKRTFLRTRIDKMVI